MGVQRLNRVIFSRWGKRAPPLWYWFTNMQERAVRYGIECAFAYNEEGYDRFAKEIGPIPASMTSPTVGRYDHDAGYVPGNFRWQSRSENSSECWSRHPGLSRHGGIAVKNSPRFNARQTAICPHCGLAGRLPPMKRWHFDHCKARA